MSNEENLHSMLRDFIDAVLTPVEESAAERTTRARCNRFGKWVQDQWIQLPDPDAFVRRFTDDDITITDEEWRLFFYRHVQLFIEVYDLDMRRFAHTIVHSKFPPAMQHLLIANTVRALDHLTREIGETSEDTVAEHLTGLGF